MSMEEIWKDIEGYEGYYQLSNLGEVKSLEREIIYPNGSKRVIEEKILKKVTNNGYVVYSFHKNRIMKVIKLHILLAKHFIPNPNNYKFVRHLNDIRSDNLIKNLAWGDYQLNAEDKVRNGKSTKGDKHHFFGKKGDNSVNSKIILDTSTGIFYYGSKEASEAKGINISTLRGILRGRTKNKTSLIYV